jgi:Ca-activated chloride channel family protein
MRPSVGRRYLTQGMARLTETPLSSRQANGTLDIVAGRLTMIERHRALPALFVAASVLMAGCSPGGSSSGSNPAVPPPANPAPAPPVPTIQVLPASYNFGKVTADNLSAPLQVTISNKGTGALAVSGVTLNSPSGSPYTLAVGGGSKPCGSSATTIAASDSCTVEVLFQPPTPGTFDSSLQITSNATNTPSVSVPISGTREQIQSISVRINQLDTACPSNTVTAYVSVIDQGGFPVLQLVAANFSIEQTAIALPVLSANYVESVNAPIAISGAMDYSGSITDQPVAFEDMKAGFSSLFANLRTGDTGEIIKFDEVVEIAQPYTTDKTLLQAAIAAPFDMGRNTRLYDAVFQAVDDTAIKTGYRRAVIVTTDGRDNASTHSLTESITNAVNKKVAVFAIGLGSSIARTALQQMADQSGGQYYEAGTSQNLATIYMQLSSLLYAKQYVITFNQLPKGASDVVSDVIIRATAGAVTGSGTKSIASCN